MKKITVETTLMDNTFHVETFTDLYPSEVPKMLSEWCASGMKIGDEDTKYLFIPAHRISHFNVTVEED